MSNKQLTDKRYLESLNYKDNHYLISLCQTIWEFIKNAPVPIYANIVNSPVDQEDVCISIYVGEKFQTFSVDNNISYFDFVFLIKTFTKTFYPQFNFEEEVEEELDTEEMLKIAAETKTSLNDVVFMTKPVIKKQHGIIQKIMLTDDQFLFEYNGFKSIRTSVTTNILEEILPLRSFLITVRKMCYKNDSGKNIRDYILNNSKELKQLPTIENDVIINYPKSMMLNFFRIHFADLSNIPLEKICDLQHRWGKFIIQFADDLNEFECLDYYRKRKNKK